MGFYEQITSNFGVDATRQMKKWSKLNSKLAAAVNQRIFLHEWKRNGLKPRHISQNTKHLFKCFDENEQHFIAIYFMNILKLITANLGRQQ